MNKKRAITSYKFYWGGIADFKELASNLALNVSTGKCFEIPNKTYMYRFRQHFKYTNMNVSSEDLFLRRYNELIELRNTTDFYKVLKSSAMLRQLLIDENPLIHIVNRKLRLKIEFKVDNTFHQTLPMGSAILYTSTEVGNMVLRFSKQLQILNLNKFLNLNIIAIDGEIFTVIELIKFASNKQGGVHYENSKSNDESGLKKSLEKLEKLKTPALAIAINTIVEIVLIALRPVKEALTILPDYSNFIAHYDLSKEGSIFFEGKQWMHTDNMNTNIKDCFGCFGQIKLAHQKFDGKRFIYCIGNTHDPGFEFSVYVNKDRGIGCEVNLSNTKSLIVETPDLRNSGLFDSFISLGCAFTYKDQIAKLELFINNNSVGSKMLELKKMNKMIDRHVIGGDFKGKRNATFYIKELVLLRDGLSDENIQKINLYFERKYRAS